MDSGKRNNRYTPQNPNSSEEPGQDRPSNLRLGPLTPEQAIAGIFKIKPEDVKRIREEEKKMKGGKKK